MDRVLTHRVTPARLPAWLPACPQLAESLFPALTGGFPFMMLGVSAYLGERTSEDSRTARMGASHIMFGLSVPLGMALSGPLYQAVG